MPSLSSLNHITPLTIQLIISGVFGAILGSFGTMLLWRIPRDENFHGRSRCTNCNKTIEWYDLVPILSYLILRGKCRACEERIATRYIFVEISTTILFVLLAFHFRSLAIPTFAALSVAVYCTLLIAVYDAHTQRIPDVLILWLIVAALCYQTGNAMTDSHAIQGAFSGAGFFLLFFGLLWITGRGKWMGSGDVLLGTALGLLLGLQQSILMLFLAYISGGIVVSILLFFHRINRKSTIPFGPFLAGAALCSLFFGDALIEIYL